MRNIQQRKRSRSLTSLADLQFLIKDLRTIVVKEQNPIEFFYALFTTVATPGCKVIAHKSIQIMDPITGDHEIAQIQVRKVFASNAKPLLCDCFIRGTNTTSDEKEEKAYGRDSNSSQSGSITLSSSFLVLSFFCPPPLSQLLFFFSFIAKARR